MSKASRDKGASEWRQHPTLTDYEVSEYGDVRRITSARTRKAGHLVKGSPNQAYWRYKLATPHGKRSFAAHRLVAEAFLGPAPTADHVVAHWDGDGHNNHWSNLRWATAQENAQDSARLGVFKGEKNGRARLTLTQVQDARSRYSGRHGEISKLAREYGLSTSAMRSALVGEHWSVG